MKEGVGQAIRHTGRTLHLLSRLLLSLLVLFVLAAGGLAWRLAQGPMEIGWLAQRLERVAAERFHQDLAIGRAALTWEGFQKGLDSPLEIRLDRVVLRDADGRRVADVPQANLQLSAGQLAVGRIVPRVLELEGLRLRVERLQDGGIRVGVEKAGAAEETPLDAGAGPGAAEGLEALLQALERPLTGDRDAAASMWTQMRALRLRDAALSVHDARLGATWRAKGVELDLTRLPAGGATGQGRFTLSLGKKPSTGSPPTGNPGENLAGRELHADVTATLGGGDGTLTVQTRLSPFTPARLAAVAPAFGALAAANVPVTLAATATFGGDLALRKLAVRAEVGAGQVMAGTLALPVAGAVVQAEGELAGGSLTKGRIHIERLELAPRQERPHTILHADVQAERTGGKIAADLSADMDQINFGDLAAVWPSWLGGPGLQPWITENITGGIAKNAKVKLHLIAPDSTSREDLSNADVTELSGGLDGEDMTVSWLKPVPPLEHANARLNFLSPEALEIVVSGARQAGGTQGGLVVQGGRIFITGLNVHDQFMTIDADTAGPVADLVRLLRHPRVHLLDRRPIDVRDPSGSVSGHLRVVQLPLKHDLTVEEVRIEATGRLSKLHLTGIAAGEDLDQGNLEYTVNNDGLKLKGTATLGQIPSQIQAEMDFRDGGPTQVLQKVTLSGKATPAQLIRLGVADGETLGGGPTNLHIVAQTRRNGRGDVTVKADLAAAELTLAGLNFRKKEGTRAEAELHLLTEHDRPTGIDSFRVEGEDIFAQGSVRFAGGVAQAVRLARLKLGDATDISGDIGIPRRAGEPWTARLSGRSIDASAQFAHDSKAPEKPQASGSPPGPPWKVQATFDRVVLGEGGREVRRFSIDAENDGEVTRRGILTGQTKGGAAFTLEIAPRTGGRHLTVDTADAGGLLWAAGVVNDMRGGTLAIRGDYNDKAAGHPLRGTAEVTDFRMQKAPALVKLLQIMTFYGLVDVLQGPGLGFSRLVAPFQMTGDVLELSNARAFSPSLGLTAKGQVDLARGQMAVEGTIVPAYFFNTLLGEIPLVGRLFSPEQGGGLFAATYSMKGSLDDPSVAVNPLAALTPGFLRGLFDIFDHATPDSQPAPSSAIGGDR